MMYIERFEKKNKYNIRKSFEFEVTDKGNITSQNHLIISRFAENSMHKIAVGHSCRKPKCDFICCQLMKCPVSVHVII